MAVVRKIKPHGFSNEQVLLYLKVFAGHYTIDELRKRLSLCRKALVELAEKHGIDLSYHSIHNPKPWCELAIDENGEIVEYFSVTAHKNWLVNEY